MRGRALVIESISVEATGLSNGGTSDAAAGRIARRPRCARLRPVLCTSTAHGGTRRSSTAPTCAPATASTGPAIIHEANTTIVVEPGWRAECSARDDLILRRVRLLTRAYAIGTQADPVLLEVFNNLFMSIAEQMGVTLANTATSVNIKERLDFSCALFDAQGNLIANAPHMPVHLGSMGESVQEILRRRSGEMRPGDMYVLNAPYAGGTHLPDVTVVMPVFLDADAS